MTKYKKLSWLAVFLWMALIFYLSHQPSSVSSELSSGITEFIINAAEKLVPDIGIDLRDFHYIVRKNAHFIAYFILGILSINAIKSDKISGKHSIFLALGISVLYAMSDEFHQLFIAGRSGEVRDVFIDSSGALAGIVIYSGVMRIRKIKKPYLKKNFYSEEIEK